MGKVTQSTAATAEETASASEEMSAQAEHMKQVSLILVDIIGGSNGGAVSDNRPQDGKERKGMKGIFSSVAAKRKAKDQTREDLDRLIPMDENF